MIFLYDLFLTVFVGVVFTFSSIMSIPKTLESIIASRYVECSKVIVFLKCWESILYCPHLDYILDRLYHICMIMFVSLPFSPPCYEKEFFLSFLVFELIYFNTYKNTLNEVA